MKSKRQERILSLIEKYEIETQDDMMSRLRDEGFAVTQATVSRDLRELKLTKTLTSHGTYRYSRPAHPHMANHAKLSRTMTDSIIRVDYAMNIVVLKTYPGMAPAVAAGVDTLNFPGTLGCVAGDDTIMVVAKDKESARKICEKLNDMIEGR